MTIYDAQYLSTLPRAKITVTYPDGASHTVGVTDGHAVGVVRDAIQFFGPGVTAALASWTDNLRAAHRRVGRPWAR